MREVCYCGWSGYVEDRLPIRDDSGLACPNCGHVDDLRWLPDDVRQQLILAATSRYDTSATTLRLAA